MGSRAGQVMKKGTLCCAGSASFMAGYMMYGGRMIILGDSGQRVGENMAGGEIYVGGRIDSLGCDAALVDAAAEEIQAIDEFLERYGIPFKGKFKKVVSAGNDLTYPTPEPSTTRISYPVFPQPIRPIGMRRSSKTCGSRVGSAATESEGTGPPGTFPILTTWRLKQILPGRSTSGRTSHRSTCEP
jgi:hypothetical protein